MDRIRLIGVGGCGSNIVSEFETYGDAYSTVSIDNIMHDNVQENIHFEEELNDDIPAHEKYESKNYDYSDLEDSCKNVQIFVSGASDVSGLVLKVLEYLNSKKCNVGVFYIMPELKFSTELQKMQHYVTFGVLQEYARSGLISNMIILDNAILGKLIGKTSISNYYPKINKQIANFIHTYNFCGKNEPIFGHKNTFLDITRIGTLGYGPLGGDIVLFFDIKSNDGDMIFPLEIQYHLLVPEHKIKNDENLMTEILETVEKEEEKYKSISYGVYEISSEHDDVNVLVYLRTSKIQQTV